MIYARISIHQALKYRWKQSGVPELKNEIKIYYINLSFYYQG